MARGPRNLRVAADGVGLTQFGGVALIEQFFQRIGLQGALWRHVRFAQRNNRYSISESLKALLYPLILGLGRIETTEPLRYNGVFHYLAGLPGYPQASSLRRFLERLARAGRNALLKLHDRWRAAMIGHPAQIIFDLDSTVLTVYGRQERAAVGYNPKKRGRPSYLPLLCFEGNTQDCWEGSYHPGNTHVSTITIPLLERAFAKLPEPIREVRVRADGAFFDHKIIEFIEGKGAFYAIGARLTRPLKNRVGGVARQRPRAPRDPRHRRERPEPRPADSQHRVEQGQRGGEDRQLGQPRPRTPAKHGPREHTRHLGSPGGKISRRTGALRLGEDQPVGCSVVVKQLRVASPVDGDLQLPPGLVLAEVFIEHVVEEVVGQGAVGLGFQRAFDLPQQRHVRQRRLAEQHLAREDVGLGEGPALRGQLDIALVHAEEAQHPAGLDDGQQVVHLHHQLGGQPVEVVAPLAALQDLEQAGDPAGARVRQHRILDWSAARRRRGLPLGRQYVPNLRLRQHIVDMVHQLEESLRLALAGARQPYLEVGADARRVVPQHDDPVGQHHRFLDVVRDQKDRTRRHLPVQPQFHQFTPQGFGR